MNKHYDGCDGEIFWAPDPYAEEMGEEDLPDEPWCECQYNNRKADI